MNCTKLDIQQINTAIQSNQLFAETSWAGKIPLAEAISQNQLVVIHFLRNFGCIYCHNLVDSLHTAVQRNPNFPPIIFVHLESIEAGRSFFQKRFPGAQHVADTGQQLYRLFGIKNFSWVSFFNPVMLWKGISLFLKGYRPGVQQHIQVLSGTFLVKNGSVVWGHQARYPGDDQLFPTSQRVS